MQIKWYTLNRIVNELMGYVSEYQCNKKEVCELFLRDKA